MSLFRTALKKLAFPILVFGLLGGCGRNTIPFEPTQTEMVSETPSLEVENTEIATPTGVDSATETPSVSSGFWWQTTRRIGKGFLQTLSLSSEGRVLNAITTLGVWQIDTSSLEVVDFLEVPEPFTALAVNQEGRMIVTGNQIGEVVFWIIDNSELAESMRVETSLLETNEVPRIDQTVYSGNGEFVATGTDRRISLWRDGKEVDFYRPEQDVVSLKFNPSGQWLAALLDPGTTVEPIIPPHVLLFDLATWERVADQEAYINYSGLQSGLYGPTRDSNMVSFNSGNGRLAYATQANRVEIFDPAAEEVTLNLEIEQGPITSLALDESTSRISVGTLNGSVHVLNTQEGMLLDRWKAHDTAVQDLMFINGTGLLVSGAEELLVRNLAEDGNTQSIVEGFLPASSDIAHIPGQDLVAVINHGLGVRLIDLSNGNSTQVIPSTKEVVSITVNPASGDIAVGSENTVKIIDPTDLTEIEAISLDGGFPSSVAFSSDGMRFAVSTIGGSGIQVWDAATWSFSRAIDLEIEGSFDITWSPSGELLAAVSQSGRSPANEIFLIDVEAAEIVGKLVAQNDLNQDRSVALDKITFTPDGTKIVATTSDPVSIRIWQIDTGEETLLQVPHLESTWGRHLIMLDLAVSSDGQYLFGASSDGFIRVWSLQDLEYLSALRGHKMDVTGLDFDRSRNLLFSTSLDGTVRIWEQAANP